MTCPTMTGFVSDGNGGYIQKIVSGPGSGLSANQQSGIANPASTATNIGASGMTQPGSNNFVMPTGLVPSTVSNSFSSSSNNSRSGINWNRDIAKAMLPDLISSGKNAYQTAQNLPGLLQDQYNNTMRRSMQPENFQGVLNQLAQRGMIRSGEASNAMANAGRGIARDIADKGFESQIAGANAQMAVPPILAQLASLAQESTSSSGTSSRSGSVQQDPLAQYELAMRAAGIL